MELRTWTPAQRPDMAARSRELDSVWPRFLHHDPNGLFYGLAEHAEHTLLATADDPDDLVGRAFTVPFRLPGGDSAALPVDGLNEVVRWSAHALLTGAEPDAVASVEVAIRPDARRRGWGTQLLAALLANARRLGFSALYAPVRPPLKELEPELPLSDYVERIRADGLPADPWLRAHVKLGGRIVALAPYSTVVPGSLAEWREWTGLPFDRSGEVVVPGALVPVLCSVEQGVAVYVEPNVWVSHHL